MDWDQIENKWVAMTRRVRADWAIDRSDAKAPMARRGTRIDGPTATIADRQTATVVDRRLKMSAE
jgi:hypothetical protein